MAAPTTRELERVRYWQGQLLASGDLRTQIRSDAELRALHNRAIHRAYGIAIGLTPTLVEGKLELTCGMAYDCDGRGLVVAQDRTIDLPAQMTGSPTLVLSCDPTDVCGVALSWKPAQDVNPAREVAITRLNLGPAGAQIDPDFMRAVARPMARPRLATGTTIPGETAWKSWQVGDSEVGVEVVVDTSAAGYTRIPHYFAEAVAGKPTEDLVWFASMAEPSPKSFKLQLLMRGITRQPFDIADPKPQIAAAPTLDRTIALNGNVLAKGDLVARLLPIGQRLSLITKLSGKTATLDVPLNDLDATKPVAFGNLPRVAKVTKVSEPASFFEVTVNQPTSFQEGDVVVKLGAHPENARPAVIASVDDSGTLELLPSIAGLAAGDPLGVARQAAKVVVIAGADVTVTDPAPFSVGDVVVRLGTAVETSAPATILAKKTDGTLTLSAAISGLKNGDALGIAKAAGTVLDVVDNSDEVKIQVDSVAPFRKHDLVARISHGLASRPVRVEHIHSTSKTLTLSGAIAGLALTDTIAAAGFPVRATAQKVDGKTVTLADATAFPKDAHVARLINDLLKASPPAAVVSSAGQTLTLDGAIADLAAGDVIGLCDFPTAVQVQAVLTDGSIVVSQVDAIQARDVVTARGGLALVAEAGGTSVRLAAPLDGLRAGDSLSVATVGGVVNVTPGSSNLTVSIDQPSRLRAGDFLADITGWRQATAGNSTVALVTEVEGNQITVSALLDGSLTNDTIGLATVTPELLQLRLNKMPDLKPGDGVLLAGLDRLEGTSRSLFAYVDRPSPFPNVVLLRLEEGARAPRFAFRPEDISASMLFLRGSALALIQKHELFVSWLSCGDPEPLPKPCAGAVVPDCPCAQSKE
jgi:hypothetical protein